VKTLPSNDSVSQSAIAEIRAELDLAQAAARDLAWESLSENTRRLYESDWRGFLSWVQRAQSANSALCALPANDETLALYVGAHVDDKPSTLARRLAAIRLMHNWSRHESPFDTAPSFIAVYAGYKRRWASRCPSKSSQTAATESILKKMVDSQPIDSMLGLRNRALLLIGFDAALRRSELVGIDIEHITAQSDGLELYLPKSKSDQMGDGNSVFLLARSASEYCPVSALSSWLDISKINDGAVFRRLHRCGLSLRLGSERLSGKAVYRLVKDTAANCGVAGRFGAHSLRRGLITSALQSNQNIGAIQGHVRHQNLSTTSRYAEQVKGFDSHPGKELLGG